MEQIVFHDIIRRNYIMLGENQLRYQSNRTLRTIMVTKHYMCNPSSSNTAQSRILTDANMHSGE